jgi:hypothetical protein
MVKRVAAIAIGLGVIVAACGGGGDSSGWSSSQRTEARHACKTKGGVGADTCACLVNWLEDHYSFSEYKVLDNGGGPKSAASAKKAFAACS